MKRLKIILPLAVLLVLSFVIIFSTSVSAALPTIRVAAAVKDSDKIATTYSNSATTVRCGKSSSSALGATMIFDGISIPAGSKIYSATITFTASASKTSQVINSRIYAEDTAAPASYGAAEDWSARTYTSAYVDFDGTKTWTSGTAYPTGDLSTVVQELVDSYAPYVSGSMAFEWIDDTSTASNFLQAYSYEGDSSKAPLLTLYYSPPDAYWVSGGGTWNNTGSSLHWSLSDGGVGDGAITPGVTTNVHFTANSFSDPGNDTVQIATIQQAHMKNMDWTGVTCTPVFSYASSASMDIYGDLTLAANMQFNQFLVYCHATGTTVTWTSNGVQVQGNIYFGADSTNGTYNLADDFHFENGGQSLNVQGTATLNTNDHNIETDKEWHISSIANFGTSTITWTAAVTNAPYANTGTIDADLATFNFAYAGGTTTLTLGSAAYGTIYVRSPYTLTGNNTITNLTFTSAASGSSLSGWNAITNLYLIGVNYFYLGVGQTITNLTIAGTDAGANRCNVYSSTFGTPVTLTVGTLACSNVNFRDITGAGAASWNLSAITGYSGDCGGNSGITFTSPAIIYAVEIGGAVNFSSSAIWATTTGGLGGSARIPLPQDFAYFDLHSVLIPGCTITLNLAAHPGIDASAVTLTPTFSATTAYFYRSLNIGTVTWSVTNTCMYGRSTQTLKSTVYLTNLYLRPLGYSVTLDGDLGCTGTIYHEAGIFNTSSLYNYDVTAATLDSYTTTSYLRTLVLNGSYIVLNSTTASAYKWNISSTNLTLLCGTSVIYLTNSTSNSGYFRGSGCTYYYLYITGAGNYSTTFVDANTFNTIYIDRSVANKTINGAFTETLSHFTIPTSSTRTITITNTDFVMASGVVLGDYLIISGSAASGGATFYASVGGHSTNNGSNSGWIWTGTTPPTGQSNDPTDVTYIGARMNGQLLTAGSYPTFTCYFQYGPTIAYGFNTLGAATILTGAGTFSYYLSPYHTYHYRAVILYGYSEYIYGTDKTISLSGGIDQAAAAFADPGESQGQALVNAAPTAIPRMYKEGSTGGLFGLGPVFSGALGAADIPEAVFWYPIAFLVALVLGFIAFGLTRTLLMQAAVSAIVMAAFAGGGKLGDGLLPYLTVVIFLIEALLIWLIQEKQNV